MTYRLEDRAKVLSPGVCVYRIPYNGEEMGKGSAGTRSVTAVSSELVWAGSFGTTQKKTSTNSKHICCTHMCRQSRGTNAIYYSSGRRCANCVWLNIRRIQREDNGNHNRKNQLIIPASAEMKYKNTIWYSLTFLFLVFKLSFVSTFVYSSVN